MRKRTFYQTVQRARLVDEALAAVRETRNTIDPDLLHRVREAIGAAAETAQDVKRRPMQAERVPVDQKKNLTIIMKYLELNPGNKAVQREVNSFLSQR